VNGEFTELFSGKISVESQPLPELLAWQYLALCKIILQDVDFSGARGVRRHKKVS
jgi:hypothetical protein